METTLVLARFADSGRTDITAFSALPDAPVLAERTSRIRRSIDGLQARWTRTEAVSASPHTAGGARMTACV